jgi:hypothetical protein
VENLAWEFSKRDSLLAAMSARAKVMEKLEYPAFLTTVPAVRFQNRTT